MNLGATTSFLVGKSYSVSFPVSMRKPCCEKQEIRKGSWSKEEDQKLIDYIKKHGEGCWRSLPQAAGLRRCGKSCRLRWLNYLRPDLKHGDFGEDEEDLIIRLHALLGNRWSLIAGRLPGRTDNKVKNYWNSHIRKKLIQMGHDPSNLHCFKGTTIRTRKPLDPNNDDETFKQISSHANNIIDDDLAFDFTGETKCNLNNLPHLSLDLTLSTDGSSESKIQ